MKFIRNMIQKILYYYLAIFRINFYNSTIYLIKFNKI